MWIFYFLNKVLIFTQGSLFLKKVMSKKITIINPHGFCSGVSRAIKLAQDAAQKYPQKTYLLGEIVHNQFVVNDLEKNFGIKTVNSIKDIPNDSVIIIRAHGAAPEVYKKALEKKLTIIDATCPLVTKVHQDVKKLISENKDIIYITSDINHDEAVGVYAQAPQNITLTTLKDINNLEINNPQNTVIITQTTLSIFETKKALNLIKQKYPQITIQPHICFATTERQEAVVKAAEKSDLIIIVGSLISSNSKRLVEVAQSVGITSHIVETADDLKPDWFKGTDKIAVSSGASTPENLLNEVIEKIKNI